MSKAIGITTLCSTCGLVMTLTQFTYNGFGVRPLVLAEAGAPAANSHMWSITVDPKLRLHPSGRVDPYIVGGVGYYRRTIEFTQPTVAPVFLFDPFFGGTRFSIEARYQYAATGNLPMRMIPLTVGIKW
jgi:hypothetical protein